MNFLLEKKPSVQSQEALPPTGGLVPMMTDVLHHFAMSASAAQISDHLRASPAQDPIQQVLDAFSAFKLTTTPISVKEIDQTLLPCAIGLAGAPAILMENSDGQVSLRTQSGTALFDLKTLADTADAQAYLITKTLSVPRDASARLANINPLKNLGGTRLVWILISALFSNVLGLATSLFVMVVYDRVLPNKAVESLYSLAIGVALAVMFDGILRKARSAIVDRAGRDADVRVTEDIFDQFVAVSGGQKRKSVGELAAVMRNYEIFREFMTTATVLTFVDLPFVFLYIFVIWQVADLLFIVPLIAVPVVVVTVLAVQPLMTRNSRDATKMAVSRQGLLVEILNGLESLRVTGAFALMKQRFLMQAGQQRHLSAHSRDFSAQVGAVIAAVQQAVQVLTIVLGFHLFAAGSITMGAIIAAVILSGRAMAPLAKLGQTMGRANMALSAYRNVTQFLAIERPEAVASLGRQFESKAPAIEISNVTLRLQANATPLFSGLNLRLAPGERVALVGRTGSGKSSLLRMINGLLRPELGAVHIGGVLVDAIPRSDLPSIIGTVFQQPWLFSGSLRDNVGLGRPGVTDADILRALETVGLSGEAASNLLSLDMQIAEQGANLSGGQRQAVTVARALVTAPEIYLMDEPSSAMDSHLEALLIRQIQTQLLGKTLVMVTHKAKLLELCDRVILLEKGQIIRDVPMRDYLAATKAAAVKTIGSVPQVPR